jgi:hypothetical protein
LKLCLPEQAVASSAIQQAQPKLARGLVGRNQ